MASANTVTIVGAAGTNVVSQLQVTSSQAFAAANLAANSIESLFSTYGQLNINTGYAGTAPIIGSAGGSGVPTNDGTLVVGTLTNAVQGLLINNTGLTTASNVRVVGGETVLSGMGNLLFSDNGVGTQIITGGGTNTINFTGNSMFGTFIGDGANTINVNSSTGVTSIYGTSASVDTINGTGTGQISYTSAAGSSAIINPGSANVTVFGAAGGTVSVFGGYGTDQLTVNSGTGYFAGGTNGGNVLTSSAVGLTTLVGGGNGDVLTSYGTGDVLVASTGAETLNGANSSGGLNLWASSTGSSLMFGSTTTGDTFFTSTSTVQGVGFEGTFIDMHTAPNTSLPGLNHASNEIVVGLGDTGGLANFASVGDFVSGTDKIVLVTANIGANYTLSYATVNGNEAMTTLTTTNGSTILLYNAHVVAGDITKV
jgi:hypothetical protein